MASKLLFIKDYIENQVLEGIEQQALASILGVQPSMVSTYKTGSYKPSITVAINAYKNVGLVFHPFSEDSLKYEIAQERD